jgi:hypothetical protein
MLSVLPTLEIRNPKTGADGCAHLDAIIIALLTHCSRTPSASLYFGHAQAFPRIKLFERRVIPLKATPARLIGYFEGASADDAIKQAIVEREISDPLTQSRLAAQKVREIAT